MLIDLHAHSSGISKCCRADAKTIIDISKTAGIDGLVLTNHYVSSYFALGKSREFALSYVKEYEYARKCGAAAGVKVFFGIEVTAEKHGGAHLLVYGVDDKFVLDNSEMYSYPQRKLYRAVKESGGILVWAHPYRMSPQDDIDLNFVDGVEINCHPKYGSTHIADVVKMADEYDLLVTCGGDYHHDVPYRPLCGTYFDDKVSDIKDVVAKLKSAASIKMLVHEVGESKPFEFEYHKKLARD